MSSSTSTDGIYTAGAREARHSYTCPGIIYIDGVSLDSRLNTLSDAKLKDIAVQVLGSHDDKQ